MNTNQELQRYIVEAIKWEPHLRDTNIDIAVDHNAVKLTGSVNSFMKKVAVEQTVKNVVGVTTVLDSVIVKLEDWNKRSDKELAKSIADVLMWHWEVPTENIMVTVVDGWVLLNGELKWNYQKESVKNAIANITGITGITNNIEIIISSEDRLEKKNIQNAIERSSVIGCKNIGIFVFNNIVTLKGHVDSWNQKMEAGRLAWNDPGVKSVRNELHVDFPRKLESSAI